MKSHRLELIYIWIDIGLAVDAISKAPIWPKLQPFNLQKQKNIYIYTAFIIFFK